MTPKEKNSKLTAAWFRANMDYDSSTGVFSWSKPGFGRTVGKIVGSRLWSKGKSYLTMKVAGEIYYAHRLAWLHHYGEWPDGFVDHIDEDRTNNAIENLRLATPSQNAARRPTKRSISPSRGVFPHGTGYVARLHFNNKRHYLGYFSTVEAAQAAYEAKAREIHGEFAHPVEDVAVPRGDFLNVPQCEMCGRNGKWGASDIRRDTTPHGKIRGALCLQCWVFVSRANHDKVELQRLYRLGMQYLDRLSIFDEDHPRFDPHVSAVSLFDPVAVKRKNGLEVRPETHDG